MVVHMNIEHIYRYPVEKVIKTYLNKYPTVKEANVLEMKTVERRREKNGVEYLRRIAVCANVLPRLLRKLTLLDAASLHFQEECWLNFSKRQHTIRTENISYAKHGRLTENSIFSPVAENPHWTKFEQSGDIEVFGLGRLSYVVESFMKTFMQRGAMKSIIILEEMLCEKYPEKSLESL